ncbi:MAG: helix-turn-helix transcriptional regulator [Eubacteriales bacterium]
MDILGTGSKIKEIRTLRKMTMKELGLAVGFPKSSADVRIAQYESDARAIKPDILEKIAFALDVNPDFLAAPQPLGSTSFMQILLMLTSHILPTQHIQFQFSNLKC